MQPERGDVRAERARVRQPGPPVAPPRAGHSFTLVRRAGGRCRVRSAAFLRVTGPGQMRFGGHDDLSLSACTQVMQAAWLPPAGGLEEERPPEKWDTCGGDPGPVLVGFLWGPLRVFGGSRSWSFKVLVFELPGPDPRRPTPARSQLTAAYGMISR